VGELGSGKTTFVRYLLKELGYQDPVVSPTYPLMIEYEIGKQRYIHIDAYRLGRNDLLPWDWTEWAGAIVFVEWAERISFPEENFTYRIESELKNDGKAREVKRIDLQKASDSGKVTN